MAVVGRKIQEEKNPRYFVLRRGAVSLLTGRYHLCITVLYVLVWTHTAREIHQQRIIEPSDTSARISSVSG